MIRSPVSTEPSRCVALYVLPEHIPARIHSELSSGALGRPIVIATHDRDRHSLELTHHELRCRRNLVGDCEHTRLECEAVVVYLPPVIGERCQARDADGYVHDPFAPRTPE